jgi:zinc/manganese transport system substrate-binding protein
MIMILSEMITSLIFRRKAGILSLIPILVLTVACGAGESTDDEMKVVVTTSIWGDVVGEIVGDDGTVEILIPRGSDAHDYQATPRQVASLTDADLVVANGLGLEEGLHDVLQSARSDGANLLELAPELDPIPFGVDNHEHGDLDPHVWFDPARVGDAAALIAEALSVLEPDVDWQARADAYMEEMTRLTAEMTSTLDRVPDDDRKLVTNHQALGYFADTFGFEVVGVVVPGGSTLADPSSAELAALVEVIESEQVPAIFTETSGSDQLARAVASEVGTQIAVVELYTESLGEPGSSAETLAGMLQENAARVAGALG